MTTTPSGLPALAMPFMPIDIDLNASIGSKPQSVLNSTSLGATESRNFGEYCFHSALCCSCAKLSPNTTSESAGSSERSSAAAALVEPPPAAPPAKRLVVPHVDPDPAGVGLALG